MTIVRDKATKPASAGSARGRSLWSVGCQLLGPALLCLYAFVFLRWPIAAGLVDDAQQLISRGAFVLSAILVPEQIISAWFDDGRLPSGFLDRVPIIAATLGWLSLAACVGWPLCRPLRGTWQAPSDATLPGSSPNSVTPLSYGFMLALAILVGLALLSSVTLLIGLSGGLHSRWPLVASLTGLLGVVWGWDWISTACHSSRLVRSNSHDHQSVLVHAVSHVASLDQSWGMFDRVLQVATRLLCVSLGLVIMLGAWVPPSEFDVLEYHLQAPKEFYQLGAIRFLPHNIYANMPLGTEMHTLAMMVLMGSEDTWWAGLAGKSISASITLVGAWLLGAFITKQYGSLAGWIAAGLWLAIPGMAQVASLGLIDGSLAVYVLATALVLVSGLRHQSAGSLSANTAEVAGVAHGCSLETQSSWFVVGLLAGAAAATKYPGLLFAVLPAMGLSCWIMLERRSLTTERASRMAGLPWGLIVGLMVTCGVWYAKNTWQAGNPVYPLAAEFLGGRSLTPDKIEQWQAAHRLPLVASGEAGFIAGALASLQAGLAALNRLWLTSSFVQPAVICGLVLALACSWQVRGLTKSRDVTEGERRLQSELRVWLVWSLWILAVWCLATHRIDRFWLPLTGLCVASAAVGLNWLRQQGQVWLAHAIVVLGLGYGLIVNSTIMADNRYFVALAALRDDVGDDNHVPRVSPAMAWINQHLDSHKRVLLIGEARVFEFRVPVVYSTCFDLNPGESWLRARSSTDQAAALREHGITHILVNWSEIARYRSPGNYGFSDWPQQADVQQWLDAGLCRAVTWEIPDAQTQLLEVIPGASPLAVD